MADGHAAYDPDRLPWLSEERKPRRSSNGNPLLFWAFLAAVLVAGLSYWLGVQSVTAPDDFADILGKSPPAATMQLPEPADEVPGGERVPRSPVPGVRPVAEPPPVPIPGVERARPVPASPPAKARASHPASTQAKARAAPRKARARPAPARRAVAAARPARLQPWPAAVSAGANGRVVRIGAFSTRRQAKKGWWAIIRHYPGMKRLKAVVAPVPSRRTGRTLYRLQFGTTSQAHSEVLCQRMRIIGQSCVVVGLPARGGVRR